MFGWAFGLLPIHCYKTTMKVDRSQYSTAISYDHLMDQFAINSRDQI